MMTSQNDTRRVIALSVAIVQIYMIDDSKNEVVVNVSQLT
jgi:hypothetical protein